MVPILRSASRYWLLLICFAATGSAFAQAGKMVLAVGDVAVVRGAERTRLVQGAAVNVGDTIVTGAQSYAQIRFTDEALVALKPDSEFRIERYDYTGRNDGSESAAFRLVKGGLRTLTGQIGRINHDQYQLLTTQATIGIRGTHYTALLCVEGACRNGDVAARAGLYGAGYEGRVVVANTFGTGEFGVGEFFVAPDGEAPQRLLSPPAFLSQQLETGTLVASNAPVELGLAGVPETPRAPALPIPPFTFQATEDFNGPELISVGKSVVVGSDRYTLELDGTTDPNLQLSLDSSGRLIGFKNANLSATLGTAAVVDAGSDGRGNGLDIGAGLNWGRWQGPGSTITQALGSQIVHNDGGDLHYIYGNVATNMPASGQVSYAAIGGTRPTDSGTGTVGTLISGGTINVNFTTAQLALTGLAVGFTDATYTMNGSTSILKDRFSTAPGGATFGCAGGGCQALIAGNFAGFFAGPGGAGIGLDYYFNTRPGGVIEGVAGYHKCTGGRC
jgi:FecR protein